MAICGAVEGACALALLFYANAQAHEVWPIFVVLVVLGTARAFLGPAGSSLAPNLVPAAGACERHLAQRFGLAACQYSRAGRRRAFLRRFRCSWPSAPRQPVTLLAVGSVLMIAAPAQKISKQATSLETLLAGFRYIWHEKVVLGAISLDLFAVLMGGAVALMPIFANDILDVGPTGLGFCAPRRASVPSRRR